MRKSLSLSIFPFLLVFYEICTYLSNDMYLPALPDMMRDLHLSMGQAQWSLTVWFLGGASMPLIMGAASDRFGRRPVLLTGGLIYIAATIVCALTNNFLTLLIARAVEGSMIPAMMVPGYACIHESYPQKQAIKLLALMGSISILAPAFGPFLGGLVLLFGTWRTIFWFIAVSAAIAIALLYRFMPETLTQDKRQSLHLQTLFLSYKKIIINKNYMRLMAVLGFMFAGFIVWISAGPLLVIENFQQSALTFGWIQIIIFAANIIGNRMVKTLLEFLTVGRLIQLGLAITFFGGFLMLAFALILGESLSAFVTAMSCYSFGSALCFSSLNRLIIESSGEPMGQRMAIFSAAICIFSALGSAGASLFFDGTIMSIACLVAFAIAISCLIMQWQRSN